MEAFIARQPIFNGAMDIEGYELLYRDASGPNEARVVDGSRATSRVLSDAITLFGLPKLTNLRPAFINFTKELILNDFVRLAKPHEVVIEILEDSIVSEDFIQRLHELKKDGYVLALDDYTGQPEFDEILPLVNILKVDFLLTNEKTQRLVARKMRGTGVTLLAEKVEDEAVFQRALGMGYTLFQGYFFGKPSIMKKKLPSIAKTSYGRLLIELQQAEVDFDRCARIVKEDVVLTFGILQKARSLRYYRGNSVASVKMAIMLIGIGELRRWTILMLARENNMTQSQELVRISYLRGIFTERLMQHSSLAGESQDGFFLGMFSLLDRILNRSMEELLQEISLPDGIARALRGEKDTPLGAILRFVKSYEAGEVQALQTEIGLNIGDREITNLYFECILEADKVFGGLVEEPS